MRAKGFEKALQETNKNAKNAKTASEQKEVGFTFLVPPCRTYTFAFLPNLPSTVFFMRDDRLDKMCKPAPRGEGWGPRVCFVSVFKGGFVFFSAPRRFEGEAGSSGFDRTLLVVPCGIVTVSKCLQYNTSSFYVHSLGSLMFVITQVTDKKDKKGCL